jgi:hypothetical protein
MMAKKNQIATAPEVSKLPMKQDESPLVIDLPDGQKLVVGRMENGSVIEVATWRGTGRPDSRTSRLMLGMSSSASAPADASQAEPAKTNSKPDALAVVKAAASKVLSLVKQIPLTPLTKKVQAKFSKKSDKPFIKTVANESKPRESDDVEDWLNSILAKSEAKTAAAKTEVTSKTERVVKPATTKKPVKKAAAKKTAAKKTKGRTR